MLIAPWENRTTLLTGASEEWNMATSMFPTGTTETVESGRYGPDRA